MTRQRGEWRIIAFFFPLMAPLINLSWKINEPKSGLAQANLVIRCRPVSISVFESRFTSLISWRNLSYQAAEVCVYVYSHCSPTESRNNRPHLWTQYGLSRNQINGTCAYYQSEIHVEIHGNSISNSRLFFPERRTRVSTSNIEKRVKQDPLMVELK